MAKPKGLMALILLSYAGSETDRSKRRIRLPYPRLPNRLRVPTKAASLHQAPEPLNTNHLNWPGANYLELCQSRWYVWLREQPKQWTEPRLPTTLVAGTPLKEGAKLQAL